MSETNKALAKYTLYTGPEYRAALLKNLQKIGKEDRVLLLTMTFDPTEPPIREIMDAVVLAAKEGAHVTVGIDAHAFMLPNGKTGLIPRYNAGSQSSQNYPSTENKQHYIDTINSTTHGTAAVINKHGNSIGLPIAGRSHIKIALVNDQIYIGGCNLQDSHFVDMMIGWESKKEADILYRTLRPIVLQGNSKQALQATDKKIILNDEASIFIDAGTRNQSLIFDEAMKMIDSAKEWILMTCQYFPNSTTARHLRNAKKRGVKVEIIYTHPGHHGRLGGLGQKASISFEKLRNPASLFSDGLARQDPFVHAKLIASDKGVMIGSHNYVRAGVLLGTAEIALKSSDGKLAEEAVKTIRGAL